MTRPELRAANVAAPSSAMDDYFAVFDLPRRYELDLGELERRYFELSRQVHPDRFVGRPAAERVAALQRSMLANTAYNALRRPVPRAQHLLALHGITIGDREQLDPAFLMSVLEASEELAEAKAAGERDAVAALEAQMRERRDAALVVIAEGFARVDDPDSSGGDARADALAHIKEQLVLLRYLDRYLEQAQQDDEDPE